MGPPARSWRAGAEDALKFGRKLVEDYAKTAPKEEAEGGGEQ